MEGGREVAGAKVGADAGEATLRDGAATGVEETRLEEVWGRWEESVRGAGAAEQVSRPDGTQAGVREAGSTEASAPAPPPKKPDVPPEPHAPHEPAVAPREPVVAPRGPVAAPPETGAAREAHEGVAGDASELASASAVPPLARPKAEKGSRAAAVRESLRPRVERVRDASRGMFEEAAEDSGLRFVIIAVALFLIFLLFLFLNSRLR